MNEFIEKVKKFNIEVIVGMILVELELLIYKVEEE